MWIVDGISAKSADRSKCGVETCYRVGSGLLAGWIAKFSAFSSTSFVWGAGRARGVFTSSISTSVDGRGGFLGVFLVDDAIVQYKREYEKEEKVLF